MSGRKLSDSLRPASFRGLLFYVEDTGFSAGRRTQVHEYPQRDKPYVEDLGRATRELDFVGFLVGDDYVAQANQFIAALEKEGPGTLVHPWLGSLDVCLRELGRVSFNQSLGRASISMSFVEAGELDFPLAGASTQSATRIAAGNLELAAIESFVSNFSIKGFQDFVTEAATGQLGDVLGVVSSSEVGHVLGLANSLARSTAAIIGVISAPSSLATRVMNAFGLSGVATTTAAWSSIVRSLSRVSGSKSLSSPKASSSTPSRRQATANATAVNALVRQSMLVQAVGASSLVGTATDIPEAGMIPGAVSVSSGARQVSYQEMIAVRDELLAAIDTEAMQASDAVYDALQAARNAVWADLTARARDSARLIDVTLPEVVPAVVVAYDRHEDAERDGEIISRNSIRHPGFVPAQSIKVMTR